MKPIFDARNLCTDICKTIFVILEVQFHHEGGLSKTRYFELFFSACSIFSPNKNSALRDDWKFQNGCFFGKVPNGLCPPPPSFSENYIADFPTKIRQKCVCSLWRECYNINVLYDPISHEMHVVQQFNMVFG